MVAAMTLDRFWDMVRRDCAIPAHMPHLGPCWEWTGVRTNQGYGRVQIRRKRQMAHRVAWEATNGDRGGMDVLHHCDNPPCCNPSHLFLGGRRENYYDMVSKGRGRVLRGSEIGTSTLTEGQAAYLKSGALNRYGDISRAARCFGVRRQTVRHVRDGKTWGHVCSSP